MFKQKQQLINLHINLSQYGLHPSDWNIIKYDPSTFIILNKFEKDFYFIGKLAERNSPKWKYITLASI